MKQLKLAVAADGVSAVFHGVMNASWNGYRKGRGMPTTKQTFANRTEVPIYVSVEPWPKCFELEPGDKLTLSWNMPTDGDAMLVEFINSQELVVWPNGEIDDIQYLMNGEPATDRIWTFKHP
ncbi:MULTISPECIES: hypothetical protein [unclassified Sphingomonas]|uniref:hypothetical protein n=1 Tax=unclassified Sphingomonas TaxID=196159 RepID=UPI001F2D63C0|nr:MULTISPECIES: hypothetical protein [unclassified Sphingomonas]